MVLGVLYHMGLFLSHFSTNAAIIQNVEIMSKLRQLTVSSLFVLIPEARGWSGWGGQKFARV